MKPIQHCLGCKNREYPCVGPCACKIDMVQITVHAARGDCPDGRFSREDVVVDVVKLVPPPEQVPRGEWPLWAKGLALLARREDKGVGDTVRRLIGEPASAKFKQWYAAHHDGACCGCGDRQRRLNERYPYDPG